MTSDSRTTREYKSSPSSRKHKHDSSTTTQPNGIIKEITKAVSSSQEITEDVDNSQNALEQKQSR